MWKATTIILIAVSAAINTSGQSTIFNQFQTIDEASSADGTTIVVTDFQTDLYSGEGGAAALGYLYLIAQLLDTTSTSVFDIENWEADILLYPNPAKGRVQLSIDQPDVFEIDISLLDQTGRIARSWTRSLVPAGNNNIELDLSGITAGMYFILLTNREESKMRALPVQIAK